MKYKLGILIGLFITFCTLINTDTYAASSDKKSGDFVYYVNNGEVEILSYSGNAKNLVIPDKIKGKKVTVIQSGAIKNNKYIKTIKLGRYIKTIYGDDEGFFPNCKNIKKVTVHSKNKYFFSKNGVLFNKKEKKGIALQYYPQGQKGAYTIPNNVKVIYGGAFINCTKLTSVTIPKSVLKVGPNPFRGCNKLCQIKVAKANSKYKSVGGVLLNKKGTTLVSFPNAKSSKYTIPKNVKKIEGYAFSKNKKLTSITLPKKVTKIESEAFSNCTKLKSITIEGKVSIYNQFKNCPKLEKVIVKNKKADFIVNYNDDCYGCALGIFYIEKHDLDAYQSKNVRLYAPEGSLAEAFALKNNISFKKMD